MQDKSDDSINRLIQMFNVTGEIDHLKQAHRMLTRGPVTTQDQIEQFVYINAYMSQYYIQVEPDEQLMLKHAQEAAKYDQIQGLVQLAGAYTVLSQPESARQLAEKVWGKFVQAGLIVPTTDEDGAPVFKTQASRLVPETQTLINYCRVLTDLELLAEAEAVLDLALEKDDEDPVVLHEMAWVQNLRGNYEEARFLLQKTRAVYTQMGYGDADEVVRDLDAKLAQFGAAENGAENGE